MTAKILVVDDEPDLELLVTQKFRKQIRTQEYHLIFARSGVEAISKLRDAPDIDMVLSDINMPEMDGLTLLAKVNHINPIIKTVIVSGYGDMVNIRKAMNGGAFDFLTKPIDFQDLEITINKTLHHVQQLKETRRLQQEQEKLLRQQSLAFENIYDGIIITNGDGEIIDLNPIAQMMFGYSKAEALGKPLGIIYRSSDFAVQTQQILDEIIHNDRFLDEISCFRRDGTQGVCETVVVPLYDKSGNIVATIAVNHDITRRQRESAEIRRALEKEKEFSALKSRFITMASHEFRTPLTTILSSSDILKHFSERLTDDKKLQHINRIQTSVKHMTQLLEEVLILGKAESGRILFAPVRLDLEAFCREILEEISLASGETHRLDFECQGERSQVEMDEKILRQILTNLLSNAVKYSKKGALVQFKLKRENGQAVFQIRDEGIGIPVAEQSRLFEVFHRASNVGNISGTGLGLAITKQAVELHGGSIAVESEEGAGTTFTVCLPIL
jgi:PAS domain S-box-containing protein